eukprot:GDKJ01007952.1.p1 GENE.GDKJ01007952.1~~GDKJ01007952.1.p1  ORF type:complete len:1101 (-),score=371.67 GDKJ01007952.1:237-3539(-)
MEIPKQIVPFLNAAKRLVDAAEETKQCVRAGQALSSVIYQLPEPSVVLPYVLDYLEGRNKVKWHATIPAASAIFAAVDLKLVRSTKEANPPCFATALLSSRHEVLNSTYAPLLLRLIELRSLYHEPAQEFRGDAAMYVPLLNFALGAALRAFGPRSVLQLAPLQILKFTMSEYRWGAATRSWWIPLIKSQCRRSDSIFFVTDILPVIVALRERVAKGEEEGTMTPVEAKKTQILIQQLWSVLPALLSTAIDLEIAFTKSALPRALMAGLEDQDASEFCLKALRLAAVHSSSLSEAMKIESEMKTQRESWGGEVGMDAAAAAARGIEASGSSTFNEVFLNLALQAGMKLSNDLPKEEETAAIAATATANSTLKAMKLTGGLLGPLFKVVLEIYKATSLQSGNSATTVVDEAHRQATLALEAIKALTKLVDVASVDKNLTDLCASLLKLVLGQSVSSFSLEMTCMADIIDCLVHNASDAALDVAVNVFMPIIAMHPDKQLTANTKLAQNVTTDENDDASSTVSVSKLAARSLQRRAYRLLRHALVRLSNRDVIPSTDLLGSLWTKLSDSLASCHVSALSARMQCLETFLELCNKAMNAYGVNVFSQFRTTVTMNVSREIVTRSREVSKDVRRGAIACLEQLCHFCGDIMEDLVKILMIGLAGDSKTTKPSALVCLSRVFSRHANKMSENFVTQVCDTTLMLLRDREKATLREAIRFSIVVVRIFPAELVKFRLPAFLELISNETAPQVRLRVRRLIDRLIVKVGAEEMQKVMPESHQPLLTYVLRAQRRKARKALKGAKRQVIEGEILSDEESESSDGENARRKNDAFGLGTVTGDSQLSDLSSLDGDDKGVQSIRWGGVAGKTAARKQQSQAGNELENSSELLDSDDEERLEMMRVRNAYVESKSGQKRKTDGLWLVEKNGETMDLADQTMTAANVLSKRTKSSRRDEDEDVYVDEKGHKQSVEVGEDGKILVRDFTLEDEQKSKTKESRLESLARKRLDQLKGDRLKQRETKKEEAKNSEKYKKHEDEVKKRRIGHFSVHSGSEFKSSKAGGDVVTKDRNMAPVAYVKLNPMLMKEKYVGQSTKSLEQLFQKKKGKKRQH